MLKFISWIVMVLIGVVAVLFAVANREIVSVDLWPLPIVQPVPLFVTVLGAALIGFVGGGIVTWFSNGSTRHRARLARRQVGSMEKDLSTLQTRIAQLEEQRTAGEGTVEKSTVSR